MTQELFEIAVIGAGAAGQMAALRSVLNNRNTIVFKGDAKTNKRARGTWVSKVVNMPYTHSVARPISAGTRDTFKWIKEESGFDDKFTEIAAAVSSLKKEAEIFVLEDSKGETYQARYVVLATGIMDMQPEINGSIEPVLPFANNGHIDYCLRCDGHHARGKITATIGHKGPAAWVAAMLHERYQPPETKIFTNGEQPAWSDEVAELVKTYKIKVIEQKITSIKGDPKTKMEAFVLEDGSEEPVEFAFAMLGQIAYNELALELGAEVTDRGNVIANDKGETTVPSFYVAGDLRDGGKYQIYTAWDQAVDSVDDIDAKLRLELRQRQLLSS
ncbi:MAG: FAD-dependent oxidoreductase [Candidatus Melainabacteria bacterium]|nr:FAD-dependent oxidoreductase [Candidatus Melainabacteria bacterium]